MRPDPRVKYLVSAMVIFQIASCYVIGASSLALPYVLALSYCLGGVLNHSLTLAIHECSHNLLFGSSRPKANKLFSIFANLPIGVPMAISFKKYHIEHHRLQGVDGYDADIPTQWEANTFNSTPRKFLWMFLQPLFYALRPMLVFPKPLSGLEVLNVAVQLSFDALVLYYCGWRSLLYLLSGTILSMGLHPMAGHFIAEHYMFSKGHETYSYYGLLNYLTFNVGYHNEHHDFPSVPGSKLPEVRRIASEFYEDLPSHPSWVMVIWRFLTEPQMSLYSRVKRSCKVQPPLAE